MEEPDTGQLTTDLDYWEVTVAGGQVVTVRAHAAEDRPTN
jgi:hypothetical protein